MRKRRAAPALAKAKQSSLAANSRTLVKNVSKDTMRNNGVEWNHTGPVIMTVLPLRLNSGGMAKYWRMYHPCAILMLLKAKGAPC